MFTFAGHFLPTNKRSVFEGVSSEVADICWNTATGGGIIRS